MTMRMKTMSGKHKEGYIAYNEGFVDDDCPYPPDNGKNQDRIDWMSGWYDGRLIDKLGHHFPEDKEKWSAYLSEK